ncbi:TetR/AcrR family transcriptional regulator [Nocardioides sp. Kera G14]|uniref:TetR/AcrR family transcriptional regulator n=1 Tax=Nocardioides sp. Kera G14 TaxID=2884264 RepID=UPI001D0F6785|nr:TetR/AcrR family transcriptional regulator [Nocardioides sp. Kera G14]UDY25421.1 TetR/AcrR family transcriptional regulator [Nocardioides sp. Kera G14]
MASDRRSRKAEATRTRLIGAARRLVAELGPDAVTIAQITSAADLGTGTFYNYFATRDDIVTAVIQDTVESMGQRLDAMTADMSDPAEVFAASLRQLMGTAVSEPVWAWFVVRIGAAHPALIDILGPRATRDLKRGIDEGRFQIENLPMTADVVFGSLLAAIHSYLSSDRQGDQPAQYAELNLRMVGLSRADAAEVCRRPLPHLPELKEAAR